jgi:hypothetical protein
VSRIIIAALAVTLAVPAVAGERREKFVSQGVTYTYSIADRDGVQVISGSNSLSEKFRLKVKDGRVTGYVEGRPVAFRTKATLASDVEVAAR